MSHPCTLAHPHDKIVIIGAGLFGLTTALELTQRGYKNITVLDRYLPPVPDGSSVDISRVIRPDYADPFYARLGLEAIRAWEDEYSSFFYRSGLLCLSEGGDHAYLERSRRNVEGLGGSVEALSGDEVGRRISGLQHGDLAQVKGYFNAVGGWADARGCIRHLASLCSERGVNFIAGDAGTVNSLVFDGRRVTGVKTKSGGVEIAVDRVILATGAWTPYLIPMEKLSVSSGQTVGFLQLTPEEAAELAGCPVIINLSSGWFAFPPTPGTNILKMARHGYGYESVVRGSKGSVVSAPKMDGNNATSSFIPEDADAALREGLALLLPKFKDRPFVKRRLCWYTDTPKGDFIVDHHPRYDNLFMATGGSGHAFKFLPILGRYIVDGFENKATEEQRRKWAWNPSDEAISTGDGSRGGPPRRVLSPQEQAKL